jgi:hypothetical protein
LTCNNTDKHFHMNEDQLYDLASTLRHANNYLNKMRQWKQGKIDLTVPGCDPPRMMSDDELANEYATCTELISLVDGMLE